MTCTGIAIEWRRELPVRLSTRVGESFTIRVPLRVTNQSCSVEFICIDNIPESLEPLDFPGKLLSKAGRIIEVQAVQVGAMSGIRGLMSRLVRPFVGARYYLEKDLSPGCCFLVSWGSPPRVACGGELMLEIRGLGVRPGHGQLSVDLGPLDSALRGNKVYIEVDVRANTAQDPWHRFRQP